MSRVQRTGTITSAVTKQATLKSNKKATTIVLHFQDKRFSSVGSSAQSGGITKKFSAAEHDYSDQHQNGSGQRRNLGTTWIVPEMLPKPRYAMFVLPALPFYSPQI
jgi:hypothetical protein